MDKQPVIYLTFAVDFEFAHQVLNFIIAQNLSEAGHHALELFGCNVTRLASVKNGERFQQFYFFQPGRLLFEEREEIFKLQAFFGSNFDETWQQLLK